MTLLKTEHQVGFDDLIQRYILKRIVYVNSATHGYSEFEIDNHMAIFGDNNQGKTASLAGLKLALFPETSFTHCRRKFKFSGKDGDYSKEDSYAFYFPSYQSYIILEVENPDGDFCMVLYKAKGEWGYGRYFVPLAYEKIRSLFWDVKAASGEGSFAQELGLNKLGAKLKSLGAVQVTDPKDIADYLFAGHRGEPSQSRFCLCPLSDGSSRAAVDAFRNLYQLAFDIGQTDKQTLPRAIATIIEMRRGRKEERLSADLDQMMVAYRELAKEKNQLTRLENCTTRWEAIESSYTHYGKLSQQVAQDVAGVLVHLEEEERALLKIASTIEGRYNQAQQLRSSTQTRVKELTTAFNQKRGELKAAQKREQQVGEDYSCALNLKAQYLERSIYEISEILQEELDNHQKAIKTLRSDEQMRNRQQTAIREKNQYSEEVKRISKQLSENREGMLDRLSKDEATALYSINPAFSHLPDSIQLEAIESARQFASHIQIDDGVVVFGGGVLSGVHKRPYELAETRAQWAARLNWCEGEIQSLSREIDELKDSLTDIEKRNESLAKHEREVVEIERDLRLIGAISQLERDHSIASQDVISHSAELERLAEKKEVAEHEYSVAQHDEGLVIAERQKNRPRLDNVQSWVARLARTREQLGIAVTGEVAPWSGHEVSDSLIIELEEQVHTADKIAQKVKLELGGLLRDALPATDDAFNVIDSAEKLAKKIQTLQITFSELPHKKALHEKSVHAHNTTIDNQLQELREAKETVERFVKTLNEEVNQHQVSNLQAIRLSLTLNPRFTQLMKDVEYYNLYDRNLLGVEFYNRLNTFCSEFFDGKKHTLNLEMLIDSIHYEYKHHGATSFDKKSQSGGTTSTTTALILAVLLKQISPGHVAVRIPIIVDEIGTLDSSNTKTAIQTVAEHGFAVFCATPKPEPALMEGIRQWITIDRFHVQQPLVPQCHTLILPELVERIGDMAE